jgi:hypothetical protein
MNHKDEKFDKLKRWVIGISGVGMAIASIILSKQGVGITGDLAWIGTVVALSLFCAELMFNSNFDELNWTILFLGLGAYIYSIWTNIQGFYFYRGIEGTLFTNFDTTSFFGGVFMDVYPELAIAWAMGASKIGDLIGNVVKTSKDPDKLTQAKSSTNNNSGQSKPVQYQNNAPMRPVPPPPHRPGFQPSPKPYPTQHKVTTPRGEDDDEMMSRAA